MISIVVNGEEYRNFSHAEADKSLDNLSGRFSFTAKSDSKIVFPFKNGDACSVLIDSAPFLNGHIEILRSNYDTDSHEITLSGRGLLSDLIDSTVGEKLEFKGGISLAGVIRKILDLLGLTDVLVEDAVGDIKVFDKSENISAEIGTSYFEVIEGYCRKRQVLVTETSLGNIKLTRGSSDDSGFDLVNTIDNGNLSNIKAATFEENNTNRFYKYVVKSGLNVSSQNLLGQTSVSSIVNNGGEAIDKDARETRVLYLLAEKSSGKEQCLERAKWQANINRARSRSYSCTVQGHSNVNTGLVWRVNNLIDVDDDFSGVHAKMLINSVFFVSDISEGNITTIGMVNKDAYQLEPSEPEKQKKTNLLGGLS